MYLDYQPLHNTSTEDSVLAEIINHTQDYRQYLDSSRITSGHECTHKINSQLMNMSMETAGFYLLDNKAALVPRLNFPRSEIARYVPKDFRGSRFQRYIQNPTSWLSHPLYIVDELVAYTNGAIVGIDDVGQGRYGEGNRSILSGMLDFFVFSVAMMRAADERNSLHEDHCKLFRLCVRRCWNTFYRGINLWAFEQEFCRKMELRLKELDSFSLEREFMGRLGVSIPSGLTVENDEPEIDDPYFI